MSCGEGECVRHADALQDTIEEQAKEIERLKNEVAKLRWRVASKEHPAGSEWCLVLSDGPRFSLGWFGGCWVSSDGSPVEPTHWMPLPKPPAVEDKS